MKSDIRTVSQTGFRHDRHESVKNFVCGLPLAYFEFDAHDHYVESTRYGMDTLFRVFIPKEETDEYAYQWATIQLVGTAVPIVLDVRPVRKGETLKEIVKDLLDSAEELVHVDNVLMDREFDSQHVLEMISQRGLQYVVPKRMQTSEKAQAKRLLQRDHGR